MKKVKKYPIETDDNGIQLISIKRHNGSLTPVMNSSNLEKLRKISMKGKMWDRDAKKIVDVHIAPKPYSVIITKDDLSYALEIFDKTDGVYEPSSKLKLSGSPMKS